MLNEPTIEKLKPCGSPPWPTAWLEQSKNPTDREARPSTSASGCSSTPSTSPATTSASRRLLREAKLRIAERVHRGHRLSPARELDKAMVRQLAPAPGSHEHLNVVALRPDRRRQELRRLRARPEACRQGLPRALPPRAAAARRARARTRRRHYARLLARLAKADVLVLDDWGLGAARGGGAPRPARSPRGPLRPRARPSSPASCPIAKWHEWIGDPTLADAILRPPRPQRSQARAKGPLHDGRRRPPTALNVDQPASLRSDHDGRNA